MEEEIKFIFDTAKEGMENAIKHLEHALIKIRAGRANASMLESVRVDYYGSSTPLAQVGNIGTPDARTLTVQPWEKPLMAEIEKAILNAGLGLNPSNNGEMVIINIPPLTEDRRKDLVKAARAEGEEAKVSIRNVRKEANDEIKKLGTYGLSEDMVKDLEADIQEQTNAFSKKVDDILTKKEADIMHV